MIKFGVLCRLSNSLRSECLKHIEKDWIQGLYYIYSYTMGKTVKQIADEIGVSKTAVRKYMDDDFVGKYTTQEGERSPNDISIMVIRLYIPIP